MTVGPTVTSYEYTKNGELWRKTEGTATTTYTYDSLGNLRRIVLPTQPAPTQIDYVVDGRNRRIGKIVDGNLVRQWLYKDQLEPVAELDGAGNLLAEFVYASKAHVPDYMMKGGQTYRIVSDHLGSVRLIVNIAEGTVAQRLEYDPFGIVLVDSAPGWQPFGYAGGLYDSDDPAAPLPGSGLVRFGARDYDPSIGRWTAIDPTLFQGRSFNLYVYANDDPINFLDLDGRVTLGQVLTATTVAYTLYQIYSTVSNIFDFVDAANCSETLQEKGEEVERALRRNDIDGAEKAERERRDALLAFGVAAQKAARGAPLTSINPPVDPIGDALGCAKHAAGD